MVEIVSVAWQRGRRAEGTCRERPSRVRVRPALFGGIPFCRPASPGGETVGTSDFRRAVIVEVQVRDNNVDQALRALKKKMQREGLYREMRMRRHYEKPSERRAREKAEAIRRYRKLMRKRAERDEV
jgi:small subunit ribosomal protein S21